jgi:hypothetical protein
MEFAVTGVVSEGASRALNEVAGPFAELLCGHLATVLPYRPRERGLLIAMAIPHDDWYRSSKVERVRLYAEALTRGIEAVPDKHLSTADKILIIGAIATTAIDLIGA